LARLKQQIQHLREMAAAVKAAPDHQISLTDPDARAMATSGKDTGVVGYSVQVAVDAKHHLIMAHEVLPEGRLSGQCLDRRIPDKQTLIEEIAAWEHTRNKYHARADWQFTTADTRIKLKRLYPAI
jgi:fibronectin type 3 domain-containing protein